MDRQYVAYLIGGPFDLTKRQIGRPLEVIRMAGFEDPFIELHAPIPLDTPMKVVEYRLITNLRNTLDGREILIYHYEEERYVKPNC